MKTKLTHIGLLSIAYLLSIYNVYAQRSVALHSGSGVQMFQTANPFVDAYNAAQDGDTLYLSGGSFNPPSLLDKKLRIIGAGYHPDTTKFTTFPTHISTSVTYGSNASYLHIEGLRIQGNFVKHGQSNADFITLKRVFIDGVLDFQSGSEEYVSEQISVLECIINAQSNSLFSYVQNSLFANSIFAHRINTSTANNFSNNIFLYNNTYDYMLANCKYNFFNNNIFLFNGIYNLYESIGNTFSNNLIVKPNLEFGTSPIVIDNYMGIAQVDIFVNQSGNSFSFSHNYHLQTPDLYKGNDNTQIGIYGGLFPFKDSGIPSNPHISRKIISSKTNSEGKLLIEFDVHAQEK